MMCNCKDGQVENLALTFTQDGWLDLDACYLDVYELVISNPGDLTFTLVPPQFVGNNATGVGAKTPNGLRIQKEGFFRFFSGDNYRRSDRYFIAFDGGAGTRRAVVLMTGKKREPKPTL